MIELLAQNIRVIENFGRTAFTDQTNVHPVGLAVLLAAAVAMLLLPRRFALIPAFCVMAFVPSAQRLAVLELDFPFLRILVLSGLLRIFTRKETAGFEWKLLDRLVIAWALVAFVAMGIRTSGATFVYSSGVTLDALGGYFVARCLLRDWDDISRLGRTAGLLAVPISMLFLNELATQRNFFSFFGGVAEITHVREGRLRCQGPYNHPILAGCFWASLLPLIAARWWQGATAKVEASLGVGAALAIVYCCASSTPVLGFLGGVVGAVFFALRHRMRVVRWALLISVCGLHLIMNAPVWHLVSRVSAVGGSTGYHRFRLIDSFIRRFPEWALLGVNSTAHWFWGGQDVTNHFIVQGVSGGLATFVLFIAIVAVSFAGIGRALPALESQRSTLILAWALGVTLLVHCFCFIGVSYFGTITALWYLTLGAIGSVSPPSLRRVHVDSQRDFASIPAERIPVLPAGARHSRTTNR